MPQVMMWVLRKVAAVAIESIVLNMLTSLVPRRMRGAGDLDRAILPQGGPEAALPSGQVDPKVILLAEMISTALDESGVGGVQAVVANGIGPSISVIVVNAPAETAVADAEVVLPALLPEHAGEGRDHDIAA
jgi:hypothetical protein